MQPRTFLRLEGLFVLGVALYGYFSRDGSIWFFLLFALAPDLSMLGYLAGPQIGSLTYNLVHTYSLPLAVGVIGHTSGVPLAVMLALIWAGHIGADRLLGYGLKFDTGFKDTHLSTQPAPTSAFTHAES